MSKSTGWLMWLSGLRFARAKAAGLVAMAAVCWGAIWSIHVRQVIIDREACRDNIHFKEREMT
jgi:hypothetical protein